MFLLHSFDLGSFGNWAILKESLENPPEGGKLLDDFDLWI